MRWILAFAMSCLASCASTSYVTPTVSSEIALSKQDGFYVCVPRDGGYEEHVDAGSGQKTANAVRTELRRHVDTVEVGTAPETLAEAQAKAQARKLRFLVVSTIVQWEDRDTEWSGILDKLDVCIEIIDVEAGTTLHSANLRGESKWTSFGGDHPEDLLTRPLEQYFSNLFDKAPLPPEHRPPLEY